MTDTASLARLDGFPFRHRVLEVMSSPVATAPPEMSVAEAARTMRQQRISSLMVVDAARQPVGVVSERDLVGAIADQGAGAADSPISAWMSPGIVTVAADAFLYVAIGRMARLNLRHLGAVDQAGRVVGMVTTRSLMKLRASEALALGDAVTGAPDARTLAASYAQVPALARALRADGVPLGSITAIIGGVTRDLTARAGELAEAALRADGLGPAPTPYALLVLGSGGRGETLLAPDQDNALIHVAEDDAAPWFAEFGRRLADLLDAAGLPYCKGGIMAREARWRHNLAGWADQVRHWVMGGTPDSLLDVDIFFDGRAVHGVRELAAKMYDSARQEAASVPAFLMALALNAGNMGAALGSFGRLRTGDDGRVDLKAGGTFPITAAVRAMALRHGVSARGTLDRLSQLKLAEVIAPVDADRMGDALTVLQGFILDQQLIDIDAGLRPGTRIDPKRLSKEQREQMIEALKRADSLEHLIRSVVGR